jgi:hypothetical protein
MARIDADDCGYTVTFDGLSASTNEDYQTKSTNNNSSKTSHDLNSRQMWGRFWSLYQQMGDVIQWMRYYFVEKSA